MRAAGSGSGLRPATIVFSHANGFPAGTYEPIFQLWRDHGLEVHAVEKFGHDPRYPVTGNWPRLRDQLIDFIEHVASAPAYLVGHSLGGYLSLMVAMHRPDLAAGVVQLDSPLVDGWRARLLQIGKASRLGERYLPSGISKKRRTEWESADQAFAHFAAKPVFSRWAPGMLEHYIASGTEAHGTLQRLSFHREVETAIYNTLPHHLARRLRTHPLGCPVGFVRGTRSEEVRLVGMVATERLVGSRIEVVDGSHLFPMERPTETANAVLRLIGSMQA